MTISVLQSFRATLKAEPVPADAELPLDLAEWDAIPIDSCPNARKSILAAAQLLQYVTLDCDKPELVHQLIASATIAVDFDVWNRGEYPG